MKQLCLAAAFALSPAAAALAQDGRFDADLAALNAAAVGRWTGELTFYDASGPVSTVEDGFSFVVTDASGLDFAFWREGRINWETYQGDGLYRARVFNVDGSVSQRDFVYSDLHAPDGPDGAWSYVLLPQGGDQEIRVVYSGRAGEMSFVAEMRPRGSEEAFSRASSGTYRLQTGVE